MAHTASQMAQALQAIEGIVSALSGTMQGLNADQITIFGGPAKVQGLRDALARLPTISATREALNTQGAHRTNATALTCMTTIYTANPNLHTVTDLPDTREYRLEDFKGDREKCNKDQYACLDWLSRALHVCDTKRFTHELAITFIRQHCTMDAGRTVANAVKDRKNLREIIVDLEVNYSGLQHPDLALETCKAISRKENENLRAFGERVRHQAEMATRNRTNPETATGELAKDSFTAALRPSLKQELRAKLETRRRLGEPIPSFMDIVIEAHNIDEARLANDKIYRQRKDNGHAIRQVAEEDETDDEPLQSETDEDIDDMIRVINNYKQKKGGRRFGQKDKKSTKTKKPTANAKPYENTYNVEEVERYDDDGEWVTLLMVPAAERGGRRIRIKDLNVEQGECARCGLEGHRAFGPDANKCPLRMHILRPEPCGACRKGGHEPAVCPRTKYQGKN